MTDEAFDELLAKVLRAGVLASAAIIVVGGIVFLRRHGLERLPYSTFTAEPGDLRSVRGIAIDAARGSGRGLIQFGLLVLIATPVARVVLSVFAFARQRDWTYVFITLLVVSLLAASVLGT